MNETTINVRYDGTSNRLQRKALKLMLLSFAWILIMSVSIVFTPLLIVTIPALIFVLTRSIIRGVKALSEN